MRSYSLPFDLCWWYESRLGLGFSINLVRPQFGFEPFIIGQFLWMMFFIAPKSRDTGWALDLTRDKWVRICDMPAPERKKPLGEIEAEYSDFCRRSRDFSPDCKFMPEYKHELEQQYLYDDMLSMRDTK